MLTKRINRENGCPHDREVKSSLIRQELPYWESWAYVVELDEGFNFRLIRWVLKGIVDPQNAK